MYVQETMVSVDLNKHTLFTVNPKTGCAAASVFWRRLAARVGVATHARPDAAAAAAPQL